jgi:hypothetical protein
VHGDLFVAADAERADRVPGLAWDLCVGKWKNSV